jgi:hypothetical protein
MSDSVSIRKIIRAEFATKEWKKLVSNSEFKDAFERAETKGDADSLIKLGKWLLDKPAKSKG